MENSVQQIKEKGDVMLNNPQGEREVFEYLIDLVRRVENFEKEIEVSLENFCNSHRIGDRPVFTDEVPTLVIVGPSFSGELSMAKVANVFRVLHFRMPMRDPKVFNVNKLMLKDEQIIKRVIIGYQDALNELEVPFVEPSEQMQRWLLE